MSELFNQYSKIPRVPEKLIPRLHKLCGNRYMDLLLHMPVSAVHKRYVGSFDDAKSEEHITIKVKVISQHAGYNKRQPFRVIVIDKDAESTELIFFNHGAWLKKAFAVGSDIYISGVYTSTLTGGQMTHPENFTLSRKLDEISGYVPVYPLTAGITPTTMQRAIGYALLMLKCEKIGEWLPEKMIKNENWPSFIEAIYAIHKPNSAACADFQSKARLRLAFDELYTWQRAMKNVRDTSKEQNGFAHKESKKLQPTFLKNLPFELTGDQSKVLAEINKDMAEKEPMLRLTQGDVGSGKTVVAFAALLNAIEAGHQGVMMAPTEILAIQHFDNARKWLEPLGVRIGLLTGKLKAKEKREIKKLIGDGELDLVIGTHALIQDDVIFKNVSMCVIDEQHRFGVKQRLALAEGEQAPDLLVMTATPIPRTLALTAYGDMDISIIAEKPPGRTPIETRVFPIERLSEIAMSLKRLIEKGEQVYWICPLVEENEKLDLAAATDRYEVLHQIYGDDVALLHGKMKGKQKEEVLADFKAGKFKILVSTTVVEVGVDVPQATAIVIEHAERFGLAQLHQLRGRVGRGDLASNCMLLYTSPLSQYAKKRLETVKDSDDGFVLAEKDLELRGPGEVLGTAQAGRLVTRVANMMEHRDLIPLARDMARAENAPDVPFLLKAFEKDDANLMVSAG